METPIKVRYGSSLERRIKTFKEKDNVRPRNRKLVIKFVQEATSKGIGELRIIKYFGQMRYIDNLLGKDFDKATQEDIKKVVSIINTSSFKEWTKWSYRVMIKYFWKWLKGTDGFPPEVKWIKSKQDKGRITLPEDLITREDLEKLIQSCRSDMERCFVMLLYESGVRLGELLRIRIKDIDCQGNPSSCGDEV